MRKIDKRWLEIFKLQSISSISQVKDFLTSISFEPSFKIINVVGTNGKGSVSTYLAQGLYESGLKVGLFTSPHLWHANERILFNQKSINDSDFFKLLKVVRSHPQVPKNFFILLYLVALLYFKQMGCQVVILEAGIGGQEDVTNTLLGQIGVVTSIALDHQSILGQTKKEIALQKAGIINHGMRFYLPTTISDALREVFFKQAAAQGATVVSVENEAKNYQLENEKIARAILAQDFGIRSAQFLSPPGRTEVFQHNNKTTIFDVAHNLNGITASIEFLKQKGVEYEKVVMMLKKEQDFNLVKTLFKDKEVYGFQLNNLYHGKEVWGKMMISDLNLFYQTQSTSALYIGSFYLIGLLNV